jgi:hypothetical protein
MAITVAPLTTSVLNAVDRRDAGTASGINNAVARVASLLAIAVFGIVVTSTFNRSLDRYLEGSHISPAAREVLDAERSRLGAMKAPAGLPPEETRAIGEAVRGSLGASFRTVAAACSALALIASACAAWGFRSRVPASGD